jgi:hypothetical protein
MKTRTLGLLGIGALAMVLVGCAHGTATAPRISFLPDSFDQPVLKQDIAPTAQLTKKLQREERPALVTGGRSSLGGAAMLTESAAVDGKVQKKRPSAYRSKSFVNGKKANPGMLNLPKLIKMGGMAKLFGAADDTESGDLTGSVTRPGGKKVNRSKFVTMANRATRITVKKHKPAMLNMNMLIKSGFYAKMAEGAMAKSRKGNPAMLNLPMLIKMGGFACGMEKENAREPRMRRVAQKLRSSAQHQRHMRVVRATREFRARMNVNHGRAFRRQQLGGRCFGPNCKD